MFTSEPLTQRVRVVVDPNGVSRLNPAWSAAVFEDADRVPNVGDAVFAVQPDEDGADYIGNATVRLIDREHKLIYLDVDWSSFADQNEFAPARDLSINRVSAELFGGKRPARTRANGLSGGFRPRKQHVS